MQRELIQSEFIMSVLGRRDFLCKEEWAVQGSGSTQVPKRAQISMPSRETGYLA